jgi:hypothetical protein
MVYILWHLIDTGKIDLENAILGVYRTRKAAEDNAAVAGNAGEYTWITEHELWLA